jgi:hypothetical protein
MGAAIVPARARAGATLKNRTLKRESRMNATMACAWILFSAACGGSKDGDGTGDDSGPGSGIDSDGDGVSSDTDCNDAAPDIHPGAAETCNGIDDDCDGEPDDGLAFDFFRDDDVDGYGDATTSGTACTMPDGWVTDSTDCDDADANVNPGEAEICDVNGVDEDCSGLANEADPGVTDIKTWFVDDDGDGFGEPGTDTQACFAGPDQVALGTDCNDTNPSINPGTPEVCDPFDVDEDCDGLSDGADPEGPEGQSRYYVDADGDGYGDASDPGQFFCDGVPAGYTTFAEDCDDAAALVNPDARENCGDGIDNDCVGGVDDCGAIADIELLDADTSIEGTAAIAFHGFNVAGLGDINGDGQGDFATCGWNYDSIGRAWIYEGPASSGAFDPDTSASAVIDGETEFGMFAWMAAGAGDVNDDGYDDVLIGQNTSGTSAGYLWLGPVSDTVASTADAIWSDESVGALSGKLVSGDVDVNDDGFDDYLIGAEAWDDGSFTIAGAVYVIYGPGTGAHTLADADVKFAGTVGGGLVGHAATGVPDMDGDGADEVLIGATADAGGTGRGYLYYGGDLGGDFVLDKGADATYDGGTLNDQLGFAVSRATDITGDGYGDLLIDAPFSSTGLEHTGSVYVIAGPGDTSGSVDKVATAEIYGEAFGDLIGMALDGSTDLNGDGFTDLLIGAPMTDASAAATESGTAYFLYGPQTGEVSVADARCALQGSTFEEIAGFSLSFIGDQSGDGTPEILVGAPYASSGNAYIVNGERM